MTLEFCRNTPVLAAVTFQRRVSSRFCQTQSQSQGLKQLDGEEFQPAIGRGEGCESINTRKKRITWSFLERLLQGCGERI